MTYTQVVDNVVDKTLPIFSKHVETTRVMQKFQMKTIHSFVEEGVDLRFTFVDNVYNLWKTPSLLELMGQLLVNGGVGSLKISKKRPELVIEVE